MSDSDDDLPPPLEDMTEKVEKISKQKQKFVEEVTKSKSDTPTTEAPTQLPSNETSIPSSDDLKPAPAPVPKPAKQAVAKSKKKKNAGFGGLSAGFLNAPPKKKKKEVKKEPEIEDISHIKSKPSESKENLKFQEVQDALKDKKEEWCTPDLLTKIASNETLRKAFTSPEYRQCIELLQKDPKEAVKQYGTNPEFVKIMNEFSKLMGTHMEKIAEEKEKSGKL